MDNLYQKLLEEIKGENEIRKNNQKMFLRLFEESCNKVERGLTE